MSWDLNFISKKDFKEHIKNTILYYEDKLKPYNLEKFNHNIIDPIKLIFDKKIFNYSWKEIIDNEIFRQRDKSNNNEIGYFHQNIFSYIKDCDVPKEGWDIIYKNKIFVEMKNKHNTMNSSAAQKTYIKMQSQIMNNKNSKCYLVENIAKQSQNIKWEINVDKIKCSDDRIRRVSIDKFYEEITGDKEAFYKICLKIPEIIDEILKEKIIPIPNDTVYEELENNIKNNNISMILALYLLSFSTYEGFKK